MVREHQTGTLAITSKTEKFRNWRACERATANICAQQLISLIWISIVQYKQKGFIFSKLNQKGMGSFFSGFHSIKIQSIKWISFDWQICMSTATTKDTHVLRIHDAYSPNSSYPWLQFMQHTYFNTHNSWRHPSDLAMLKVNLIENKFITCGRCFIVILLHKETLWIGAVVLRLRKTLFVHYYMVG